MDKENGKEVHTKKEDTQGRGEAKVRVLYLNVSGLKKKSNYVGQFEIVGLLVETWVEERT
jgi:hypothetical protein